MEREYITHHIKNISGLENLTASKQSKVFGRLLEAVEIKLRSTRWDVRSTKSTRRCLPKYSTPAGLGYEELQGLSNPGQSDYSQMSNVLE